MSVVVTLLDLLCTFNEGMWMFLWVDLLYERREWWNELRKSWSKKLVLGGPILLYFFFVFFANRITLTSPYTFVSIMLISIPVVCILWKSNLLLANAVIGVYGLAIMASNMLIIILSQKIWGEETLLKMAYEEGIERLILLVVTGTVWFTINFILHRILKKKTWNINSLKYITVVSILGYIGITFISEQVLSSAQVDMDGMVILVLILCVTGVFVPYYIMKYKMMVTQVKMEAEKNEILVKDYDHISEFYMSNAKLYHDMKHHINALYHMLEEDKSDEARSYLKSLGQTTEQYQKTSYTSIDIVDVILSDKKSKADKKEIEMKINAQILPQDIAIEKKDLCAVFSNIIDNALESAADKIEIVIKPVQRMLMIQVRNDYKVVPQKKDGRFVTTKTDSSYHGWGLQSVESVLKKYNGEIEYDVTDEYFIVSILVNM